MKSYFVAIGLAVVTVLSIGASENCRAADVCGPRMSRPSARPCATQDKVQPVGRSVQVTVPMQQPLTPCAPPVCMPAPPIPVRVDIEVRPEGCDQRYLVPIAYRDPGFLGPIVSHSVGLIGSVIASPFRIVEMLCPLKDPACPQKQWCGPTYRPPTCGYQPPMNSSFAQECPAPIAQPATLSRRCFTCAPPGPAVAPLPPAPCRPICGPNLPPALVEEYQFPQYEAQEPSIRDLESSRQPDPERKISG